MGSNTSASVVVCDPKPVASASSANAMIEADSTVRKTVARLIASFQISDRAASRLQCSAARIAAACGPSVGSLAPPATAPPEASCAPDPGLRLPGRVRWAPSWASSTGSAVCRDTLNVPPASAYGPALFACVRRRHAHDWTGTTRYVAPRLVRLTSPERVLFPDEGITKQDLFEYYRSIAPVLVPHLRDRPFTMKRRPYGVGGDAYFQKQAPKGMPAWIPTRTYRTHPRGGGSRLVDFPLVNSTEAVLWMVQMNCIDMNAWYSRVDKPHRPDFVLFDLDPPGLDTPDGGFALAIRVAHLIREELARARARVLRQDERRGRDSCPRPDCAPSDLRADLRVRGARGARARGAARPTDAVAFRACRLSGAPRSSRSGPRAS